MEITELSAHESIRDLVASYAHMVDSGRIDELVDLFSPTASVDVVDGGTATGHDDLRTFFNGVGSSLRVAAVPRIRHHTSNLCITVNDASHARGECYFLCLTDAGVDHWGRYRDRYVVVGSRWRFESRSVRTDGWVDGGWAASRRPDDSERG